MDALNPTPIFLVEDDVKLTALVKRYLERNQFAVSIEHDGNRAIERILMEKPALVILDIMLPGKDGRTICRELRGQYDGPIVMLTALGKEVDQVVGLELGADDYITKPVRPRLLLSRINAILRFAARSGRDIPKHEPLPEAISNPEKIVLGGLEIHLPSRAVLLGGRSIELTTTQFDLLSYLGTHAGEIISRDRLFKQLRGADYNGFDRAMDQTIARLREKIGDDGKHPRMIKSIRGEGYLMVKP